VYTICEIKYLQSLVTHKVIPQMERKLKSFPNLKNYTIQKVLIAPEGADKTLEGSHYFDRILTLRDIFDLP